MRYSVRIIDPSTERHCEVYVATDEDLEVLLFFLKCAEGLRHEVRDLKDESSTP
ncbi:MAG: hypothetical protein GTN81_07855 [Proteobacteria bacterium]|nr:hypothetical protein [Pseudomonadota bacterium]